MKPIVMAFTSQKGGSGKTTATITMSAILGDMGYNVLVIDGDAQMNTTTTYRMEDSDGATFYEAMEDQDLLEDNYDVTAYIHRTSTKNVDIMPSSSKVALLDMALFMKLFKKEAYAHGVIDHIRKHPDLDYDFILFDTNPTLGLINFNIFVACDYIIVPVECSKFGIRGLDAITKFYKDARKANKKLKIAGVVLTKVDNVKSISKIAAEKVREEYGDIVFSTVIGVDTKIEKSQWDDMTILEYDKESRISRQYHSLTEEVLSVVLKD